MSDSQKFNTGAVRSADANHLDFTSMPLIGLLAVARTSSEGAKYGRYNYMLGMPVHDLLNHAFRHAIMYVLGDRSEPHLEHAAWNMMAAVQSAALDPELNDPHLLGPGATITEAIRERLAADAPDLARRRAAGEFKALGDWTIFDLPEVSRLLGQRKAVADTKARIAATQEEFAAGLAKTLAESPVLDAALVASAKAAQANAKHPIDLFGPDPAPEKPADPRKRNVVHRLKTWPQFFGLVWDGEKTAELRLNDRDFRPGDKMTLVEYDPATDMHSGREVFTKILSVTAGSDFGLKDGYVMLSFRETGRRDFTPVRDVPGLGYEK